jgi:phosphoglycolate phosphatase
MNPNWTCILFDLDGTIVDSAPGITASLAWTYEQLGRPIPSPAELLAYVGPPILDSFRERGGMTAAEAEHALGVYRPHYATTGIYDCSLYPGVAHLIRTIGASPIPLSLATSKPESLATTVLEHFDLAECFDFLTGASEDEVRSAKADVVEEALRRLAASGADTSHPVLVGDRHHDVEGAAVHGVPTIFARWGYGSRAEEVGTIAAVDSSAELERLLLG